MAVSQTIQDVKLRNATEYISRICEENNISNDAFLEIFLDYTKNTKQDSTFLREESLILFELLKSIEIPLPFIISALVQQGLTREETKENGVFYTDFRLANLFQKKASLIIKEDSTVADLAAGTGILLLAVSMAYLDKYPENFENWLSSNVFAFDISREALLGAKLAFKCFPVSETALTKMYSNWIVCDSLISETIESQAFDIIVGNPPWGKMKISRHFYLEKQGISRTYGSNYQIIDSDKFNKLKKEKINYSNCIKNKYDLLKEGEVDYYMPFLQRSMSLLKPDGYLLILVPAGLIRSKGTKPLREYLISQTRSLVFYLMNNLKRIFRIDSRFKFVLLEAQKKSSFVDTNLSNFILNICNADNQSIIPGNDVYFNIDELYSIYPDLLIPEVKNNDELDVLKKIYKNGRSWGLVDDIWKADICREVDMTNDRKNFSQDHSLGFPVIEGRMIQQHRFGAKAYVSGEGRAAKWIPINYGLFPQFNYVSPVESLSALTRDRFKVNRAGYCDIAGQTNERAMTSAIIPGNVICGNKVPTVLFPNDFSGDIKYLWVGLTNSFVFDWALRRIISTTANYFLIFSIPVPKIEIDSDIGTEIVSLTKKLSNIKSDFFGSREVAECRSRIDYLVAKAYKLDEQDMKLIFSDFPLVDKKQPSIDNESRSTITFDLILSHYKDSPNNLVYLERIKKAYIKGSKAYLPSEIVGKEVMNE